jgi:hypothetical protein
MREYNPSLYSVDSNIMGTDSVACMIEISPYSGSIIEQDISRCNDKEYHGEYLQKDKAIKKYCFWINYFSAIIFMLIFHLVQYRNFVDNVISTGEENLNEFLQSLQRDTNETIVNLINCHNIWNKRKNNDENNSNSFSYSWDLVANQDDFKLPRIPNILQDFLDGNISFDKEFNFIRVAIKWTFWIICVTLAILLIIVNILLWRKAKSYHISDGIYTKNKKSRWSWVMASLRYGDGWKCILLGCSGLFSLLVQIVGVIWIRQKLEDAKDLCKKVLFTDGLDTYGADIKAAIASFLTTLKGTIENNILTMEQLSGKLLRFKETSVDLDEILLEVEEKLACKEEIFWLYSMMVLYGATSFLIGIYLFIKNPEQKVNQTDV